MWSNAEMPVAGHEQQLVVAGRAGAVQRRVEVADLARVDVRVAGQRQRRRRDLRGHGDIFAARAPPRRSEPLSRRARPGRSPRRARRRARCRCGGGRRRARSGRPRRRRARAPRRRSAPGATTDSTRPPAETSAPPSARRGARVQHVRPGHVAGVVEPVDGVAGARACRGSRAAATTTVTAARSRPAQRPMLGERAGGRGLQQAAQRGLQPGQHHLGLGVAEPGVELDHPRPARGQGQPDVEQPGERRAAAAHLVDRRLGDPVDDARRPGRPAPTAAASRRPCRRCWGRVSPSPTRLKSCAGASGTTVVAVGEAEQRDLGAVEELLDDDPPALGQAARACASASSRSSVTTTPLPAASPSSLTTYGGPNASSAAATSSIGGADVGQRGRARRPRP